MYVISRKMVTLLFLKHLQRRKRCEPMCQLISQRSIFGFTVEKFSNKNELGAEKNQILFQVANTSLSLFLQSRLATAVNHQ